jgi:hypothetical protein
MSRVKLSFVMAGLDPAIHALTKERTWMPGTSPGMTVEGAAPFLFG